ncbi:MAG: methyltransferase domain-containing protein, partial [Gammaproteobacteria bacterium]
MTAARTLADRMVDDLAERGELAEQWRVAFAEVPRHLFIPDTVWRQDRGRPGHDLVPVRRADDPDGWLRMAYENCSVITQVDDGRSTDGDAGWEVTSSASMPAVVAQMLAALDVEPGMRVLEIGTGTGYNAALLAHRLGASSVTSIEIDPEVAGHARRALAIAGFEEVTVVTGDGTSGYPPHAPFDRVICTAAAERLPHPWIAQTTPGGKVLVPWATAYYPAGLLTLTVHTDGTATGRIGEPAAFMWLRDQRVPRYQLASVFDATPDYTVIRTDSHPADVAGDRHAATAIGLRVPRCQFLYDPDTADTGTLYLIDQWDGSWASLHLTSDGPPYEVRQAGPRSLWDELQA